MLATNLTIAGGREARTSTGAFRGFAVLAFGLAAVVFLGAAAFFGLAAAVFLGAAFFAGFSAVFCRRRLD